MSADQTQLIPNPTEERDLGRLTLLHDAIRAATNKEPSLILVREGWWPNMVRYYGIEVLHVPGIVDVMLAYQPAS